MRVVWLIVAGAAGGVLAGMGMGGGTLTIPLLVLALGVSQRAAQFVNLVAFLPTGAAALAVHTGKGLVSGGCLRYILPPALVAASVVSYFAAEVDQEVLGRVFGGFLVLVLAFCAAGVLGTVGGSLALRRRELALLRSAGATLAQLRRMLADGDGQAVALLLDDLKTGFLLGHDQQL